MVAKQERDVDPLRAIKDEILQLVQAYENGISEPELARTMSSTPPKVRADAINSLANEGKIQLCKRGAELIYRSLDSRISSNHAAFQNHSDISLEEKAVFRVVESAGSKGIWNREIRNQTKIPLNQMGKVLKNLETKKLIKAVKSVTASKKKLYMLYGLEPDKSVTGGAWYSGTDFESEYVQILHEQCYQFIKRHLVPADDERDFVAARDASLVSSSAVKEYIDNLKISNVKLSLQDIEMVLETIVFDGLIEKIIGEKKSDSPVKMSVSPTISSVSLKSEKNLTSDEEDQDTSNVIYYYRALTRLVGSTGVMRVPCGQCPRIHECRPGAVINPEMCLYLEHWF